MRGIKIAMAVVCFASAVLFINGVGYADEVSNTDAGPQVEYEGAKNITDDNEASNVGGDSFFGVNVEQSRGIQSFVNVVGKIPSIAEWLFIPESLAAELGVIATMSASLAVIQFFRGFLAES